MAAKPSVRHGRKAKKQSLHPVRRGYRHHQASSGAFLRHRGAGRSAYPANSNAHPNAHSNTDSNPNSHSDASAANANPNATSAHSDSAAYSDASAIHPTVISNSPMMDVSSRDILACHFTGTGVELGVASGAFSSKIAKSEKVERLWSIDRWCDHHDSREYKNAAASLIKSGNGKCVPLRMTFSEALPLFPDSSLDFIYIDGYARQGQEGGKTLSDWFPKLKVGGIFSGHDYHPEFPRTIKAVDRFASEIGASVNLTSEEKYPSWWFIKTQEMRPFTLMSESPVKLGESVILVGNGPSMVLNGNRGHIIDSFDQVVRFNWFAIHGFANMVGTKTTLWSTFGRGSLPRDADQRPDRAVFIHGDKPKKFEYPVKEGWGISREFFNSVNEMVKSISKRDEAGKARLLPSSGLVILAWLLEHYKVPKVSLIGFDHFSKKQSKGHHYWLTDQMGNPKAFSPPPEHDGEAERIIFQGYVDAGRASYIE